MKKLNFILLGLLIVLSLFLLEPSHTNADWWQRPDDRDIMVTRRPAEPNEYHRSPDVADPTVTPDPGEQPEPTYPPTGGTDSSTDEEDPCAPGKPFFGDYCGWSPDVDNSDDGGGGDDGDSERVGDPQVLGLSDTSGQRMAFSDILLLSGIVCLLLYVKSKLSGSFF